MPRESKTKEKAMPNRQTLNISLPPDLIKKVRALEPENLSDLSTSRKVEYLLTVGLGAIK